MCLFPGMMQGPDPAMATPEAKQHQCHLYVLAILHFSMAVMLCIALPPLGISEIFTALILMCTAYSMNFCMLIFYMIMMLMDVVQYFSSIGLLVQRGELGQCYRNEKPDECNPFVVTVIILFFVFAIIAVAVAFYAYRIFKANALGQLGGGGLLGGVPVGRNNNDDDEAPAPVYNPPPQSQPARQPL